MRKVISNTTPLLSLLKIGQLDLLERLYERVVVPEAVWMEMEAGKGGMFYLDLVTLPWVDVQKAQNKAAVQYLADLDKGEAEVIVLAQEIGADLVIIDETLGRSYAAHFRLPFTGTLGVLLRSKKEGYIQSVKPLLDEMRKKGIWISERVFKDVLALAGESPVS
jgi:uncharacterized protein